MSMESNRGVLLQKYFERGAHHSPNNTGMGEHGCQTIGLEPFE